MEVRVFDLTPEGVQREPVTAIPRTASSPRTPESRTGCYPR
jgi:hypothetical protein